MLELHTNFPEVIDNTMRVCWDGCPRKFQLEHIHHLRRSAPSIHLCAGGAYAKGLEIAREAFYSGAHTSPAAYLGLGYLAALREWSLEDPMLDSAKSLPNVLLAMRYFHETWPFDTDWLQPIQFNEKPAIEFTFAIPLEHRHPVTGNPILYAGRFDMFVEYGGAPTIYDDKTTTSLGAQWINGWNMDSQITGYIYAAREHNIHASTAIIRGVSFLKTGFGHAQAIEHRTNYEVDRWWHQTNQNLGQMIQAWEATAHATQPFPFSIGSACKSYGGCPYIPLCKKENWHEWIEPDYGVHVWNPLDIHKVREDAT